MKELELKNQMCEQKRGSKLEEQEWQSQSLNKKSGKFGWCWGQEKSKQDVLFNKDQESEYKRLEGGILGRQRKDGPW